MSKRRARTSHFKETDESPVNYWRNSSRKNSNEEQLNNKSNSNLYYSPPPHSNPILYSSEYQWRRQTNLARRHHRRMEYLTGDDDHIIREVPYEESDEDIDEIEFYHDYEEETRNAGSLVVDNGDREAYYQQHRVGFDLDEHDTRTVTSNNKMEENNCNSSSSSHQSPVEDESETRIPTSVKNSSRRNRSRSRPRTKTKNAIHHGRGGSRSDSELDSLSAHKRALHEAKSRSPTSILRKDNEPHSILWSENDPQRIRRTSSSSSLTLVDLEGEGSIANSSSHSDNLFRKALTRPSGTSTIATVSSQPFLLRRKQSSRWKKNKILLWVLTGVSYAAGMVAIYYTHGQSYASLSFTLDQVIAHAQKERQQAAAHFDFIEKELRDVRDQMLDLDPDGTFASENEEGLPGASVEKNGEETNEAPQQQRRRSATNGGSDGGDENHHLHHQRETASELLGEIVAVKEKLRIETSQMSELEKYIQASSLRDARRKYGTGIIRVQIDLDFPEDRINHNIIEDIIDNNNMYNEEDHTSIGRRRLSSLADASDTVLVLQMAPLELMPHSVYTFLEMANAKLFDGCSFILNAMHVIKAAPLPYDGGSASKKVKAFTKLGLDSVAFREYSDEYPHEQFTVGFAADGSPSFYINTKDNTEEHRGEPCFASIVSGYETVERLMSAPTRNGMWFRKRIGIKQARIL